MSEESIAANLTYQLEQSAAIRQFAYTILVAEHRGEFLRADFIAMMQFYRGLQTHEAAEILVRQKLVEDARVLVRVLVEHAVNCAYMLTVADAQTADDFVDYPRYKRYQLLQALKRTDGNLLRGSVSAEREEELRKEFEALRPRFKDRRNDGWGVDDQLYKRATRVDAIISQARQKEHTPFRWLVNSEWRFASSHVHGTADTLVNQVSQLADGITIEQKFDPEEAVGALYGANFALYLVLPFVDQFLGGKNAEKIRLRTAKWSGQA
jgi:hypothetical protein